MALQPKPIIWNLRASPGFIARLNKTAEVLDVPASQIVREAVAERIEKVAKNNPRLAAALRKLAA
jgi:predicted transcriptional regulator